MRHYLHMERGGPYWHAHCWLDNSLTFLSHGQRRALFSVCHQVCQVNVLVNLFCSLVRDTTMENVKPWSGACRNHKNQKPSTVNTEPELNKPMFLPSYRTTQRCKTRQTNCCMCERSRNVSDLFLFALSELMSFEPSTSFLIKVMML